ncbi:hypothetical protein YTPLAS72_19660 [Nitrospira sp.]|nr:hypothetical protein YTPLAS72_19660 [Nitrospira sp.]
MDRSPGKSGITWPKSQSLYLSMLTVVYNCIRLHLDRSGRTPGSEQDKDPNEYFCGMRHGLILWNSDYAL